MTVDELYDQGLTQAGEGENDKAIATFQEVLAQDPSHGEAVRALGMTYFRMGEYDKAVEAGKKLCELLPDDILAHTSLSMYYQKKNMIAEAEHEGAQARLLSWKEQLKNPPPKT
ncbi:MAG: tetratricopeptide repeat protein [Acidobacteriota bacterium]